MLAGRKIRLSEKELAIIKKTAKEVFGERVQVFIFGSRVFPEKKGGDIDILVKSTQKISSFERLTFLARLELKGISRKVDLLVFTPETVLKDIYMEAMRTGVEI